MASSIIVLVTIFAINTKFKRYTEALNHSNTRFFRSELVKQPYTDPIELFR